MEWRGIYLEGLCLNRMHSWILSHKKEDSWYLEWDPKGYYFFTCKEWLLRLPQSMFRQPLFYKEVSVNDNYTCLESEEVRRDVEERVFMSVCNMQLLVISMLHCNSMWRSLRRHKECYATNAEVKVNVKEKEFECYNHLATGLIQFLFLNGDCWLTICGTSIKVSTAFTHVLLSVVNILTLYNKDNATAMYING